MSRIYTWLKDGEHEGRALSYADLDRRARCVAATLQSLRPKPRNALLLYAPGLEFVEALFGCLYADIVAVPAYVPGNNRELPRIKGILRNAGCEIVLSTHDSLETVRKMFGANDLKVRYLATDTADDGMWEQWTGSQASRDQIAYLQYTSGSTSAPKGVKVSHANALENLQYIAAQGGFTESSRSVNWLPHFHDMGLVYGILQPMYTRFPVVGFSPSAFIHKPLRWLDAISRYRGTHCGGPNFAFDLCVERVSEEEGRALDLSSWQVAFSGAEPVRADTLGRFSKHFGRYGFRSHAFYPVYGLAEATLKVSSGDPGSGAKCCIVDGEEIKQNRVCLSDAGARNSSTFVSCGRWHAPHDVLIVDPATRRVCEPDEVGEIWISGPSVASGYWRNAAATRKTFGALTRTGTGPYLRSGDLGFVHEGELFITGRLKDCIIVRGRNHYPQDIEKGVEACHSALRQNGSAAFSIEHDGQEKVIVVSEIKRKGKDDFDGPIEAIRRVVAEGHELQAFAVVLIRAGGLPKTSSGKVQRQACKTLFLENKLPVLAQSVLGSQPDDDKQGAQSAKSTLRESPGSGRAAIETHVKQAVARVLHHPEVQIRGTQLLTSLGVDSLMVFELKRRIERELEVIVPVEKLLGEDIASVSDSIWKQIESKVQTDSGSHRLRLGARPSLIPLSYSQEQVWLMQELFPDSCAYNELLAIEVTGSLDRAALEKAVREIVRRHEILRTIFPARDGYGCQVVGPMEAMAPLVVDLDIECDTHEKLQSLARKEVSRPILLDHDSPVRFMLVRGGFQKHVLFIVAHHIVCDASSFSILVQELGTLYQVYVGGEESPLGELELQYGDYAVWQREWLKGEKLERQMEYWREQLAEVAVLELPTDHRRAAVMSHRGGSVAMRIEKELAERLRELGRR
ncbi:MAG TPA: AMP-binding protein, partial [Candidatus Angelobacter sp.]